MATLVWEKVTKNIAKFTLLRNNFNRATHLAGFLEYQQITLIFGDELPLNLYFQGKLYNLMD